MSLKIWPDGVKHFQDFSDPQQHGHDEEADHRIETEDYVMRRVSCDGCGLSMVFQPHQWVFERAQVQGWIDEHADHPDEPAVKGKTPVNTKLTPQKASSVK